jgi:CDP-glycerol glycerophosphotransferase (TagB/SpsB family)
VALHPKSSPETVAKYRGLEGEHLRYATEDNILDLFPQVDMMISDTSSALNEFLLTYKPVVTFKNRRPGPQLLDIDSPEQLLPAIERALSRPAELMQAVREYADSIHPWRDGRSSERVLAAVEDFIASGARNPRPKPPNLWRKLKIRRRIGYWGPA